MFRVGGHNKYVREAFSFDLRSLETFRFFLGCLVALQALYRLLNVENFLVEGGLVSQAEILSIVQREWSFSLYFVSKQRLWAYVLIIAQVFFGAAIAMNVRTRWSTFFAFILTVSLENRYVWITNGGDVIQRVLLFYSFFLPHGYDHGSGKKTYSSPWVICFFLQTFIIYFFCFLERRGAPWVSDFTAVSFLSMVDVFPRRLMLFVSSYPELCKFFTLGTMLVEGVLPFCLVFSFLLGRSWWVLRMFCVAVFISFHLGTGLLMHLGLFPLQGILLWVIFLPSAVWDHSTGRRLFGLVHGLRRKPGFRAWPSSKYVNSFGLFICLSLLCYNISGHLSRGKDFGPFSRVMNFFQLRQYWALFRNTYRYNFWLEATGTTQEGFRIDLFTQRAPESSRRKSFEEALSDYHWRQTFYMMNYDPGLFNLYGPFLCRHWSHKDVVNVEVVIRLQEIKKDFSYGETTNWLNSNTRCKNP